MQADARVLCDTSQHLPKKFFATPVARAGASSFGGQRGLAATCMISSGDKTGCRLGHHGADNMQRRKVVQEGASSEIATGSLQYPRFYPPLPKEIGTTRLDSTTRAHSFQQHLQCCRCYDQSRTGRRNAAQKPPGPSVYCCLAAYCLRAVLLPALLQAIDMYTGSLEQDPMNLNLYHSRGNCYLLMDEPDRYVFSPSTSLASSLLTQHIQRLFLLHAGRPMILWAAGLPHAGAAIDRSAFRIVQLGAAQREGNG